MDRTPAASHDAFGDSVAPEPSLEREDLVDSADRIDLEGPIPTIAEPEMDLPFDVMPQVCPHEPPADPMMDFSFDVSPAEDARTDLGLATRESLSESPPLSPDTGA